MSLQEMILLAMGVVVGWMVLVIAMSKLVGTTIH